MNSPSATTDTSPDARAVQLACLRKMTPQQRIRQTCSMSRQVRQMAFAAIHRSHPDLSEDDAQLLFIEVTYGADLASDLRRWKREQSH